MPSTAALAVGALVLVAAAGCVLPGGDGDGDDPETGEATRAFIGGPCRSDADCDYLDGFCLTPADGYPGGSCTQLCDRLCPDRDGHPTTFCVEVPEPPGLGASCHSRCDFDRFEAGCRAGYACEVQARAGQPSSRYGTCLPERVDTPPPADCWAELRALGLDFEPTSYAPHHPEDRPDLTCSLADPVWLQPDIGGVLWRAQGSGADPPPLLVACPLARALAEASAAMTRHGVVEVTHVGTVSCRTIGGSESLSQHGLGLAIDVAALLDRQGRRSTVAEHWERDDASPETAEGRLLYEVMRELHEARVFNVILTPDYNATHAALIHLDLTEGSHFIKSGGGTLGH